MRRSTRAAQPTKRKVESDLQRREYEAEHVEIRARQRKVRRMNASKVSNAANPALQPGPAPPSLLTPPPTQDQHDIDSLPQDHWALALNAKPEADISYRVRWDRICTHCGCILLNTEDDGWCCNKGKWVLERLRDLPEEIENLPITGRNGFARVARALNNLFCMTAMGVAGKFVPLQEPTNIVLTGRTYHRLFDLKSGEHPLRWFLYDEDYRNGEARKFNIPEPVLDTWRRFLSENNPFMQHIRAAAEESNGGDFEVAVEAPVAGGEIAAAVSTINMQSIGTRKVVFKAFGSNEAKQISIFNPFYEPLQYPILFPYGELGWDPLRKPRLTQIRHYRQRLLNEPRFQKYSKLAQEYVVDMYSRVEEERIDNLKKGRGVQHLRLAEYDDHEDGQNFDFLAQLPTSFLGSESWRSSQVADTLELCKRFGQPDLFVTMTTNPRWPEIQEKLLPSQSASDIPWYVVRIFKAKMSKMIDVLKKATGGFSYFVSVVEFQKRGLPHCHILIKLKEGLKRGAMVDALVKAELPSSEEDAELRRLVQQFMTHPENHLDNPHSRCNKDGKCEYKFPQPILEATTYDTFGRLQLRRRKEEDRWIVSHIPGLIRRFECHIHVDVPHNVGVVMYLYKYLFKGADQAKIGIMRASSSATAPEPDSEPDPIDDYINTRWLSSSEASWRIFGYNITRKDPAVHSLNVHLPNRQLGSMMAKGSKASTGSKLLYYFARPEGAEFDSLLFEEYYSKFYRRRTLDAKKRRGEHWIEEQVPGNPQPPNFVVRVAMERCTRLKVVRPQQGELFYLRKMLQVRPARTFEELKVVRGERYETFQEATVAEGIWLNKHEAEDAMQEGVEHRYSPSLLRFMMVQFLADIAAPGIVLWNRFREHLTLDFEGTEDGKNRAALRDIQKLLKERGLDIADFGLPRQPLKDTAFDREREVLERDSEEEGRAYESAAAKFNSEQREMFDLLVARYTDEEQHCLFVDGRAGRGKSFVLQAFVSWLRSQKVIVLVVGSTALSVRDYPRGRTAHAAFSVPVGKGQIEMTSRITPDSDQWKLISEVQVIIWEELPMINRSVLECVEVLLQPLKRRSNEEKGFGRTLFVGTGDFRQVAPVIQKGTRFEVIDASVKSSVLWKWFETLTLTSPMRFQDAEFSSWLDAAGDGDVDFVGDKGCGISLDQFDRLSSVEEVVDRAFPAEVLQAPELCLRRAILSPVNVVVDKYNDAVLDRIEGDVYTIHAHNWVKEAPEEQRNDLSEIAVMEYLELIREYSAPPQQLRLKPGCVCAVMRNLSPEKGLVKNARVVVESIARASVVVRTVGPGGIGTERHALPRITFEFQPPWGTYTICRRQIPLRLAYSTTFNSCQGLTLDTVVLDTSVQPFAHGQLYTALSRVRRAAHLAIIDESGKEDESFEDSSVIVSNVVWKELLA